MALLIWKKINRNIRDYGFGLFMKEMAERALGPVFGTRTYHIYIVDLDKVTIKRSPPPPGIEIRFIGPEESELVAQIEDMEEWLHGKVAGKLGKGQKCLVAVNGKEVAGFNLISFDALNVPAVRLCKPLRASECASEQITVHPKFRGMGLGSDLRSAFFLAMKEAGFRRIYGGTDATNAANRALTKKVGFKIFAKARFMRVMGRKSLRISRLRP